MHGGNGLWLFLKEFSTIRAESKGIVSGSWLVKVLDAMSPVQPSVAVSLSPTSILKLFAEEMLNSV